jgi:hypothetical protein
MMTKTFDCVDMKRQIQTRIYAETKGMTQEELLEYFHQADAKFWAGLEARQSQGEARATPAPPAT